MRYFVLMQHTSEMRLSGRLREFTPNMNIWKEFSMTRFLEKMKDQRVSVLLPVGNMRRSETIKYPNIKSARISIWMRNRSGLL